MIFGVNPVDKSFAEVNMALKGKVPQYPFILNEEAAKLYHLSNYPAIYILNNKFEVIHSYNALGKRVEKEIATVISEQLKK